LLNTLTCALHSLNGCPELDGSDLGSKALSVVRRCDRNLHRLMDDLEKWELQNRPEWPMDKVVTPPDDAARALWHGVATASDTIADMVDQIPGCSVRGNDTRGELQQAQVLLDALPRCSSARLVATALRGRP